MPTITADIMSVQPYQLNSVMVSSVVGAAPSQSLTVSSNDQTTENDSYDLKLSQEARSVTRKYQTEKEELQRNHETKKQKIESEYKQERQKLEQDYEQKRRSIGLSLYA